MICVRCQFVHLLVSGNSVSNSSLYEDALNMCLPGITKEQLGEMQNYKIELETRVLQLFVEGSCLIYIICVCFCIMVSHTYCVVFFVVVVLCDLCCQYLWITPSVFSNVYLQLAVVMIIWSRLHIHGYITSTVHFIEAEM